MTASLGNTAQGTPFATGVDSFVYPQVISDAMRAPTTQDVYNAGTRWLDNSVNPKVLYETTGAGNWASSNSSATFTNLTANGTVNLNTTGTGVTTIGTGGTGATNIGNATGNTAVTGSLTTSTSLTATLGNITATNGNLVLGTAGNKITAPAATTTAAGANAFGRVALTAGSAVVSTTAITATSIVLLTNQVLGTVTAPFSLAVTARTAATSFTITSADNTDTSTIGWVIIN